jgi:hypothetical protein
LTQKASAISNSEDPEKEEESLARRSRRTRRIWGYDVQFALRESVKPV